MVGQNEKFVKRTFWNLPKKDVFQNPICQNPAADSYDNSAQNIRREMDIQIPSPPP